MNEIRIREDLPEAFEILDPVWIPMPDGARLAARILLPRAAAERPVPAVLEYIPYRRRDGTILGDTPRHAYFAGHGYAAVRVDLRGSGDSDGVLLDEYLPQEHDDALAVIDWLASQPWCNGKVGMTGYSWGGFNALQVAARRPKALAAIIAVHATDDRYGDDCHYMGGGLLLGNLSWASTMLAYNARPPDPLVVGERWHQMWLARLEESPPFILEWLAHSLRDAYWRHGSVGEDYSAIEAAIYTVGGWADPYTNCVLRLLAKAKAPVKALIGPWAHAYPHNARPGPQIGFLQESLRWWDRWLKGIDNGIEDEPRLHAWIQDSVPPASDYEIRPGHWIAEANWPPPVPPHPFYLADGKLTEKKAPHSAAPLKHRSPQLTGITTGEWCPYGNPGELPIDQRADDGRSLVFDTSPLEKPLELLGTPELTLRLAIDQPVGIITARLCEVSPEGASTLSSYGILNLTRRHGYDRNDPMEPGKVETVTFRLNDLGQLLSAGPRLRLALSTNYWPILWPAPAPVTMTLHPADCRLDLPVRAAAAGDGAPRSFPPPQAAPNVAHSLLRKGRRQRVVEEDATTGRTVVTIHRDPGSWRLEEDGLIIDGGGVERFEQVEGDPLSAVAEIEWRYAMRRGGWALRTVSRTRLTGSRERFHLSVTLDAYEEDASGAERRIFTRTINRDLPRVGL
ncbi:MAG TPA: CocE/NonD family hydrolase [Dongiaceae bacterium]|nr:CocE/NonD family hydrolase [Dongiaceae bacterium]